MVQAALIPLAEVTLISDESVSEEGLTEVLQLLKTATGGVTAVTTVDLSASSDTGKLLGSLKPRPGEPKFKTFIAMVAKTRIAALQTTARTVGLMGSKNEWLFVVSDSNDMAEDMSPYMADMEDGDNLSFFYNTSVAQPTQPCQDEFKCVLGLAVEQYATQLSVTLEETLEIFHKVSEEEWAEMKPTKAQRSEAIIKKIKDALTSMSRCHRCTSWEAQAVEVKDADRFELLKSARWTPLTGVTVYDDLFPHVTGGFRGRRIKVTSTDNPPWHKFVRDKNNTIVGYTGLMFDILNEIGRRLNFTYEVIPPPEINKFGVLENGRYNGMMGQITRKEVLVGCGAFTVTNLRKQVVDFTTVIDKQPYTYMIARPKELSRVLLFVEPFTSDTWILIAIATLLMGPILHLVNSHSPFYAYYDLHRGRGLFTLQDCSWYIFASVLQQGGDRMPMCHSARVALGFWWVFVIIIVTTYSGNLVAFLTFPKLENAVQTLDDLLAARYSMSWGYVGGGALQDYFKGAEGKFKEIGDLATIHDREDQILLDRIRYTDYAYIQWKVNLLVIMKEEFLRTDSCDFSLGREEFYSEHVAMAMPKGSPYVWKFDEEIKLMLKGGLVQKWMQDHWPKKDRCSASAYGDGDGMRTVSLADMQGSFVLLGLGFLLALVFIIAEFVWRCAKPNLSGKGGSINSTVTTNRTNSNVNKNFSINNDDNRYDGNVKRNNWYNIDNGLNHGDQQGRSSISYVPPQHLMRYYDHRS
ncbi:ionotropic receptor 93a [Hyalella azteca]|uniref:Ionotropic receptor 93a n=1 Tax=Hyalella azteca TaxID=294128 RepID=A0A8B7PM64_HYAAZ|nr:ionotropic receptor 93a [Hyalella azteca]